MHSDGGLYQSTSDERLMEESSIWDDDYDDVEDVSSSLRGMEGGEGPSSSALVAECVSGQLRKRKRFNAKIAASSMKMEEWEELRRREKRRRREVPKATIEVNGEEGMTLGELVKRKTGLNGRTSMQGRNGVRPLRRDDQVDEYYQEPYDTMSLRETNQSLQKLVNVSGTTDVINPMNGTIKEEAEIKEEVDEMTFSDRYATFNEVPSQFFPSGQADEMIMPKEEEGEWNNGIYTPFEMDEPKVEEEEEEVTEEEGEEEEEESGMEWMEEQSSSTADNEDEKEERGIDLDEVWKKTAAKKKKELRARIYAVLGVEPPKGRPPKNEIKMLKNRLKKKFGDRAKTMLRPRRWSPDYERREEKEPIDPMCAPIKEEAEIKKEIDEELLFSVCNPTLNEVPSQFLPSNQVDDLLIPKEEEEEELNDGNIGLFDKEMIEPKEEECEEGEEEERRGREWLDGHCFPAACNDRGQEKEGIDLDEMFTKTPAHKKKELRIRIYGVLGMEPPKGRPPTNEIKMLKNRLKKKFGERAKTMFR